MNTEETNPPAVVLSTALLDRFDRGAAEKLAHLMANRFAAHEAMQGRGDWWVPLNEYQRAYGALMRQLDLAESELQQLRSNVGVER